MRECTGDLVDATFSHPGAVAQRAAHPARMAAPWGTDRPGVDGRLLHAGAGKTIFFFRSWLRQGEVGRPGLYRRWSKSARHLGPQARRAARDSRRVSIDRDAGARRPRLRTPAACGAG